LRLAGRISPSRRPPLHKCLCECLRYEHQKKVRWFLNRSRHGRGHKDMGVATSPWPPLYKSRLCVCEWVTNIKDSPLGSETAAGTTKPSDVLDQYIRGLQCRACQTPRVKVLPLSRQDKPKPAATSA
jgi:hypothetical protein